MKYFSHIVWVFQLFALVTQSCPTLWDPMDCSPPGPLSMRILWARILEWVAMPSFRESSEPRDWTLISCISGRFFTIWATREAVFIVFSFLKFLTSNKDNILILPTLILGLCHSWYVKSLMFFISKIKDVFWYYILALNPFSWVNEALAAWGWYIWTKDPEPYSTLHFNVSIQSNL